MLVRKKWLINFLITLYFIFFSLPMILVCGFPWSYKWYYMYGIEYLAALLDALAVISPWALLLMATICYKKELKLQTYVATALFFWAALTELFIILFHIIRGPPYGWIQLSSSSFLAKTFLG
ncbi:MAG: hypothetical protein DRP02_14775 [Candidatus Gerdarchaeota archaeon]|nr:MAG: hypothetical protein DRP02_14775 [Candidatus Gerdarchaeota archaeon]